MGDNGELPSERTTIDPPDDFEAIRHVLSQAAGNGHEVRSRKERP